MAKIVIAGTSNCPYYAKVELLADSLAKNLDHFKVHKIVKQESEWNDWLKNTCNQRGWKHSKSPLVWRELVDRGGKGVFIGGANDFQEYAYGYYNVKSDKTSENMKNVAAENQKIKVEMDEEDKHYRSLSKPVNVCITAASNTTAYHTIPTLVSGSCLGDNTEISLFLLDTSDKLAQLRGVEMEAFDLAYPLLRKITVTSDPQVAFKDSVAVILLDEVDQNEGEARYDWLRRNSDHFSNYAKVINKVACKDVKVIVGGQGPVNFNAFMMMESAPDIPKQNIVAMSRMVENNAKAVLSERLHVNSNDVVDVTVWGNPYGQHYLDINRARVHRYDGAIWGPPSFSLPATDMVADDKWLETEFLECVSSRRERVESAMNHKATFCRAAAITSLLKHWCEGSPAGQVFSLGVYSDGTHYGIPDSLVYSFPVSFSAGSWTVCDDLTLTPQTQTQLQTTVDDLMSEKYATFPHLKPPSPEPPVQPPSEDTQQTQEENKVFGEDGQEQEGSSDPLDTEEKPSLEKITEDKEGEEKAQIETHVVGGESQGVADSQGGAESQGGGDSQGTTGSQGEETSSQGGDSQKGGEDS